MTGQRDSSAALGALPQRTHYATSDSDEAQAFIEQMYAARPGRAAGFQRSTALSISQVTAGGMSSVDFTLPPDQTLHLDGTDDLSVSTVIAGTIQGEWGRDVDRFGVGDVCLGAWPGGDYVVKCQDLRVGILTVPASALARAAGILPDLDPTPLRFATMNPTSAAAARQWKRTSAFAREVLDDDEVAASPLVLGNISRLLASTALAVFPNSLLGSSLADVRAAQPRALRRAQEFIHEHAHTDITTVDIAAAAGVTPRALQLAFRRHYDSTPMRYLRSIRLARARRELLAADRDRATPSRQLQSAGASPTRAVSRPTTVRHTTNRPAARSLPRPHVERDAHPDHQPMRARPAAGPGRAGVDALNALG